MFLCLNNNTTVSEASIVSTAQPTLFQQPLQEGGNLLLVAIPNFKCTDTHLYIARQHILLEMLGLLAFASVLIDTMNDNMATFTSERAQQKQKANTSKQRLI